MQSRRAQPAITIRSQRAVDRLRVLTRDGRSQVAVVEDALDRMPDDTDDRAARLARLDAIVARTSQRNPPIPTMAEFDAREYDESGNPR